MYMREDRETRRELLLREQGRIYTKTNATSDSIVEEKTAQFN
jgi:hypothetical protein